MKNVRHICIVVKDLDRALDFYHDKLGLKIIKIRLEQGKYIETLLGIKGVQVIYAKLAADDTNFPMLELYYFPRNNQFYTNLSFHHISFTVNDLRKEYKRLNTLGVHCISNPILSPTKKELVCFIRDPDGNLIELVETLK